MKIRRKFRNRFKLSQVASLDKLRVSVLKSCNHVSAQVIDRDGNVLWEVSSCAKSSPVHKSSKSLKAKWVGSEIAKKIENKSNVYFDRGCYSYHGIVKIVAESARENGVEF